MNTRKVWTPQEDQTIAQLVKVCGHKNWAQISNKLMKRFGSPKRTGKQCRQRWHNHLDPRIQKKSWTKAEQDLMFNLHRQHGNKWTVIAASMQGSLSRTDNSIKNHFYSRIRRSLRRMGKFVGSKNSTQQMKLIKPSTLTKIFAAENGFPQNTFLSQQQQKIIINLKENCETVRKQIIRFTNYKPRRNDAITEKQKNVFQKVIDKIVCINNIYQKIKFCQKRKRKQDLIFQKENGRLIFSDDSFQQSEQQVKQSQFQQEISLLIQNSLQGELKLERQQIKSQNIKVIEQILVEDSKKETEQNMYFFIPTVIITRESYLGQINSNYQEINKPEIPDFLIELKDQEENIGNIEQSNGRFNLSLNSPGNYFCSQKNNPFLNFQSPNNFYFPQQGLKIIQELRPFQNLRADEFQIQLLQLQKQIQMNRRQPNAQSLENIQSQLPFFGIQQLTSKEFIE